MSHERWLDNANLPSVPMDCDVVVVGSGPSGAASAYFLSSQGLSVVCIDRLSDERFERYHSICGECISLKGSEAIGIRPEEIRNEISEFRLDWPSVGTSVVKVKGYIMDRVKVLSRLRRESESNGARFVKGAVTEVKRTEEGFLTTLRSGDSYSSRFIIGADGAFSIVRKQLFGSEPERILPVAMRVMDSPPEFPHAIRFRLMGEDRFYEWDFPYGDGRSVGAVKGVLEDGDGIPGARCIPIGWVEEFVKDGAYLVGDAAGFTNPVSFGGLRIAFETSKHAADAIVRNDERRYEKWWRSSRLSDRRFMRMSEEFASFTMDDYARFAKHLTKGYYSGGAKSVILNPKQAWLYFGCMMAVNHGW